MVSPRQVARAIGASESSLKRWCDSGQLPVIRTVGGHRRIPVKAVLSFVKEKGHPLVDPAIIGLPAAVGSGAITLSRAGEVLMEAVTTGNESLALRCLLDLYLGDVPMTTVFDDVVQTVLSGVGERWAAGELEIYEERRGVEFVSQTLFEFGRMIGGTFDEDAPVAMGGTASEDPYVLAPRMADLTVREVGFRSSFLGCGLPFGTMEKAIENERPALFWLSVSSLGPDESRFIRGCNDLFKQCEAVGTMFVIGGRSLSPELRRQVSYHSFCDTMGHLSKLAKSVITKRNAAAATGQSVDRSDGTNRLP